MRHLDQDPTNTLLRDTQHGRGRTQTRWMATGGSGEGTTSEETVMPPEKGLLSCLSARSVQNQGSQHRAVRVYDAQHRALVSNDRAQTIYSEREEEGLSWRDGIGGSPNRSEMGSKPSLIKERRGWIEKLVSWELGGRMVRKKKDLLTVRWEERSLRKERERERSHSRRNGEKRQRRQQEQSRGRVWKELRHQAAEENLSKSFAWDRTRQKERRNAGEWGRQVSWQQSKDPPTVFMAVCENSNCQSPQMTIPTLSGPSNTQNDTHVTLNPHSTWQCSASPCIGTGAGRLCG